MRFMCDDNNIIKKERGNVPHIIERTYPVYSFVARQSLQRAHAELFEGEPGIGIVGRLVELFFL